MSTPYVLVGGGLALVEIAKFLHEQNIDFYAVVHKAHGDEVVDQLDGGKDKLVNQLGRLRVVHYIIESEDELRDILYQAPAQFIFGLGPRWIFSDETRNLASRWINININKVPEFLGGAHVSWQIMNQDMNLFITFQEITGKVDRGPVLKQYKFIYPSSAKQPKDYLMFNAEKAVECFANYIDGPLHDTNAKVDIDWNNSTYWPRLRADTNGWINWSWSAEHIISFIKAFSHPYGGARTLLNGKTVLIFDAEIACKAEYHPFACGLILRAKSELKFVAVRDALIKLNLTYIEGKPKGTKTVGSRLFTPSSLLEQSLESIVTTQELNRRAEIEN